jgi:protein TonB
VNCELDFIPLPDDAPNVEISGSSSLLDHGFPAVTDQSSPAARTGRARISDAELDLSFPDYLPDLEMWGFQLAKVSVLFEKKTWASLTAVILLHVILVSLLGISPRSSATGPKSIEVRLISAPGSSGLAQESSEAGKGEQPGPPASIAPANPLNDEQTPNLASKTDRVLPTERKVEVHPKQQPEKIARVAPNREQHKNVKTSAQAPVQTVSRPDRSENSGPSDGIGPGVGADAGTSSGSGSSGQAGAGAGNGARGSGPSEVAFGSPDGPGFLRKVTPNYPALAKRLEKEGTVLLRVTIDEHGRPVQVEVLSKAGFGFEEEAVKAVKDSTFTPARMGGKPLACKALLPIRFVLKNS